VILEVGAGTGLNLAHYSKSAQVTLLEPSPHMRERLEVRVAEASTPATVVAGTAEHLPFPDESFDAVVATLVLCSVVDPQQALSEIHRVLKQDGRLVFIEHVRSSGALGTMQDVFSGVHAKLGAGCRPNRRASELLQAAGFEVDAQAFTLRGNLDPLTRTGLEGVATKRSTRIP
jgi:ubiquinone/menaquinone biosynthesis C-methylase UbiE